MQTLPTADPIDVGWNYRLTRGPTRLVLLSRAASGSNLPTYELLNLKGNKGELLFLKQDHPNLEQYENEVVELVRSHLDNETIIVLPELSGSVGLEQKIQKLLDETDKRCIVVGGSYYRTVEYSRTGREAETRVEHVCPVMIQGLPSTVYHQKKFVAAVIERIGEKQPGFDTVDRRVIQIFRNTGFGDFAVLICSDALDNDSRAKYVDLLRYQIDFLIVPAHNPAKSLPESLRTLATNQRWYVLYCNGHKNHASNIISCYHQDSEECPKIVDNVAFADLNEFQRKLRDGHSLTKCFEQERLFEPGPRHWPFRGLRASGFSDYLRVLAIGSHFDDVWLGCSGTLMRLQECYNAQVRVATLCNSYPLPYFGRYDLKNARAELEKDLNDLCEKLCFKHVPYTGPNLEDQSFSEERVHDYMQKLAEESSHIDLLFVPRQDDVHPDHMVTTKHAMLKFRSANVFEYEIKDFRRSPFRPNVLVDLGVRSNMSIELNDNSRVNISFAEKKAFILEHAFRMMDPVDLPAMFKQAHSIGRMAFRASQSGTEVAYAEAFMAEMII